MATLMEKDEIAIEAQDGQIVRLYADVATVQLEDGRKVSCTIRGKLFTEDPPAVGDRVRVESTKRDYVITEVLPRKSVLARRATGSPNKRQVLIANADQVVVVFATATPEPHLAALDRFLVVAEANRLEAFVVLNKSELGEPEALRAFMEPVHMAGYPVYYTSVKQEEGLEELREALSGKESVFTGPSGVGKSSLLNALYPGLNLKVGQVSAAYGTGRHTTVGGYLIRLPGDASVADTAGLREVGIWMVPPNELPDCFPEFRAFMDDCRFSDCAHMAEPGCAVRDAVEEGKIHPSRYESYVKLREEAEATFPRW